MCFDTLLIYIYIYIFGYKLQYFKCVFVYIFFYAITIQSSGLIRNVFIIYITKFIKLLQGRPPISITQFLISKHTGFLCTQISTASFFQTQIVLEHLIKGFVPLSLTHYVCVVEELDCLNIKVLSESVFIFPCMFLNSLSNKTPFLGLYKVIVSRTH